MKKEEYLKTQLALIHIGKMASKLDLHNFIAQIDQAHAVAPVIDPTMYMKALDNLRAIKKLATSLLSVQTAYQETFEAVLNTAVRGDMAGGPNETKV